jgi:hypothetical protein
MLSFLKYLEERKVDPAQLASRVARRFGKKEKYGKWLRAEPGGHIPLNSYRTKEADSVFNKSDRVREKIGGEHYWNSKHPDHPAAIKRYEAAHTTRTVKISDLHPTQPFVKTEDPERLSKKISEKNPSHIVVATHNARHYILDGHHAVMAAAMRGEKEVKVKHINLDEYK